MDAGARTALTRGLDAFAAIPLESLRVNSHDCSGLVGVQKRLWDERLASNWLSTRWERMRNLLIGALVQYLLGTERCFGSIRLFLNSTCSNRLSAVKYGDGGT
jgi:hypothetical protein